jgi:hypothetical protein
VAVIEVSVETETYPGIILSWYSNVTFKEVAVNLLPAITKTIFPDVAV